MGKYIGVWGRVKRGVKSVLGCKGSVGIGVGRCDGMWAGPVLGTAGPN